MDLVKKLPIASWLAPLSLACLVTFLSSLAQEASTAFPMKVPSTHLPNLVQVHERIFSGGLPQGEEAFRELSNRGIRTVISVDGAKPDVELARKYRMRYVHLPHGYHGIAPDRVEDLAKAIRELDGPIYFHCHHGKHRSPAAAAAASVASGLIEKKTALAVLRVAGTDVRYQGLFDAVARSTRIEDSILAQRVSNFPESARLPAIAESMVLLDQTFQSLKEQAANRFSTLDGVNQGKPAHDALLLNELFHEIKRMESVRKEPAAFLEFLESSESLSETLMIATETWTNDSTSSASLDTALQSLAQIAEKCDRCHRTFRDVRDVK